MLNNSEVLEAHVCEVEVAETPVSETPVGEVLVTDTLVSETPVAETPVAETQDTNDVVKSIIDLIKDSIKENENIKLTPDEVKFIKLILANSPQSFTDIENCVNSIISDNTINASDIPKFLTLVKDFYVVIQNVNASNTSLTGKQLVNISANIIKFILPITLKKNNVYNDTIVQNTNTIIDTCVDLLLVIPQVKKCKCSLLCF